MPTGRRSKAGATVPGTNMTSASRKMALFVSVRFCWLGLAMALAVIHVPTCGAVHWKLEPAESGHEMMRPVPVVELQEPAAVAVAKSTVIVFRSQVLIALTVYSAT